MQKRAGMEAQYADRARSGCGAPPHRGHRNILVNEPDSAVHIAFAAPVTKAKPG